MATYPGARQAFVNAIGTEKLSSPDHGLYHGTLQDTVVAVEDVLGTTAGTSVLTHFAVGEFPARVTGVAAKGTLQQTIVGGTLGTNVLLAPTGTVNLQVGTIGTVNTNLGTIGTLNTNLGTVGTLVAGTQPSVIAGTYTTVNSIPGSALSTNAVLLGYAALTGTQTLTTETVLSNGTLAITNPSGGRRIKVTLFIANCSNNGANNFSTYRIIEAGGTIQTAQKLLASAGNGETSLVLWSGTTSAGAHTYTASCTASGGTATITNTASIVSFLQAELI